MTIYPSILTDSLKKAQDQLSAVFGKVSTVQIDIVDGKFAQNQTIHIKDLHLLKFGNMKFDLHLMTKNPLQDLENCSNFPALRAIISQVETMISQQEFVHKVQALNKRVGFSVNLYSRIALIQEEIWKQIDILQLMGIEAGFQGKVFQPIILNKIRGSSKRIVQQDLTIELLIDGGIKPEQVVMCKKAGASSFSVGSFLWNAEDIDGALQELVFRN